MGREAGGGYKGSAVPGRRPGWEGPAAQGRKGKGPLAAHRTNALTAWETEERGEGDAP